MEEECVILAKTYPQPSTKYRETTCVAAITDQGQFLRLFPVPFRLLGGEQQFKKWERIRCFVQRTLSDIRPESRRLDSASIVRLGDPIPTRGGWIDRLSMLDNSLNLNPQELEIRRGISGQTIGIVRVERLESLIIRECSESSWTQEDIAKLTAEDLFDSAEVKQRAPLRKLPHDFWYEYFCPDREGKLLKFKHKLTDWEVGALYWNCRSSHGGDWEKPFRQRYFDSMRSKDLRLILGTIHRFPDQWLIIGLIYPPKLPDGTGTHVQPQFDFS